MARWSESRKTMKFAEGDIVVNEWDMKGKVIQVMTMKTQATVQGLLRNFYDVLLVVDYTRGKGEPNVINAGEVVAVRVDGAWLNRQGHPVTVHA